MPRMTGRWLQWTAAVVLVVGIILSRPRSVPTFPRVPRMKTFPGLARWHNGTACANGGTLSTRAPLKPGLPAILTRTFREKPFAAAEQRGVSMGISSGTAAG